MWGRHEICHSLLFSSLPFPSILSYNGGASTFSFAYTEQGFSSFLFVIIRDMVSFANGLFSFLFIHHIYNRSLERDIHIYTHALSFQAPAFFFPFLVTFLVSESFFFNSLLRRCCMSMQCHLSLSHTHTVAPVVDRTFPFTHVTIRLGI